MPVLYLFVNKNRSQHVPKPDFQNKYSTLNSPTETKPHASQECFTGLLNRMNLLKTHDFSSLPLELRRAVPESI
jgi:hypothetical protein